MRILKGYADLADGQLHYRFLPGQGLPAVFLHQTASSGAMWEKVMSALAPGRPLYALDTPGFGGSFDPAGPAGMRDYVRWMREALASLDIRRVHLVGHHTGAAIAIALQHHHPDIAASLVLIGPDYVRMSERKDMAARFGTTFRPGRSGAYLLRNWEYLRVGGADADILLLHREMIGMLRAYATRPDAYRAVWETDFASAYDALDCPTMIMSAPDDLMFEGFERAKAARPDVPAVTLSGGANFEPDLVSDEVAAAIHSFWTGLD
jgi:pimeloyl-ACP methyl ester carboxylesterase